MNVRTKLMAGAAMAAFLVTPAIAEERTRGSATDRLLNDIGAAVEYAITDVVDETVAKARTVVRENTGIDLSRRGYHTKSDRGDAERERRDVNDKTRQELRKLSKEHDRELTKLESELQRKLAKASDEFEREARKEDKVEKVQEKRNKLRHKVDEAYAKFDEKLAEENRRFDEKRARILRK